MSQLTQNALFLAGVLLASGATYFPGGGFFVEAWRHRRGEREYLLFGLAMLALGSYSVAAGGVYLAGALGAWEWVGLFCDVVFASSGPAAALLIDFAMRYTRRRRRAVASACYAVALVSFCVAWLGYWRGPVTQGDVVVLGLSLPAIHAHMTWLGSGFSALHILMLASACGYLLRAHRGASEGSVAMLAGSVLLLGAGIHDAASLGLGLFESVSLLPLGFIVFVYGVAITLVARYGRLSEQLAARRLELGQRSAELAQSLAELQRAQANLVHSEQLAVVGEFAAVITHEVRNPMAIVNNAVTGLRRFEAVTEDTRSLLGIIEHEMARLERLVTHLLNYARPVVPQRKSVSLADLLERCLAEPMRAHRDVDYATECQGEWPLMVVDADMLEQAFENIIVNAIQAMDGRGQLSVKVARRRVDGVPSIIIGFEDTGEGMTEHQLEQATSPFYTTRPAGTGLGLAICERIVEAHGGILVVSSERGVGTAVSVIIPEGSDERLRAARRTASLLPVVRDV